MRYRLKSLLTRSGCRRRVYKTRRLDPHHHLIAITLGRLNAHPWEESCRNACAFSRRCSSLSPSRIVAASAKDAASGQFEILTLSNRADLISGGDALVEVRVPNTVPLHQVTLWLNGTRRHGHLPHRCGRAHHARGADRPGGGAERVPRRLERPRPRPAARFAHHHQPSDRRAGAAGLADARHGSARRPRLSPHRATRRRRTRAA